MTPTPFHDWLHALPGPRVQALRDFRRLARAAYPNEPDSLAKALDSGKLPELLRPGAHRGKTLSPDEEAAIILGMPREYVLRV